MKRFVKYEVHDYMDLYPREEVRVFCGESVEQITETAHNWAKEMCMMYSGGNTRIVSVMNIEEAKAHCDKVISNEMSNPQEDSDEFIQLINNHFKECYL